MDARDCHHYAPFPDPVLFDPTLLEGDLPLPLLEDLDYGRGPVMTEFPLLDDDDALQQWNHAALLEAAAAAALSDVAKSPGSHFASTDASSSLSPSAASQHILTPSSTLESPYVSPRDDPESDANTPTSPESENDHGEDFVFVHRSDGQPRPRASRMSGLSAPGTSSGVLPTASASASVSAHPLSSDRSRGGSQPYAPHQAMQPQHWPTFVSSSDPMDDFNNTFNYSGLPNNDFSLFNDLTANASGGFDDTINTSQPYESLPFRITSHPQPYHQAFTSQPHAFTTPTTSAPVYSHQGYTQSLGPNNTFIADRPQPYGNNYPLQSYLQLTQANVHPHPVLPSNPIRIPHQSGVIDAPVRASRHAHPHARVKVRATKTETNPSPTSSHQSANAFDDMNVQQSTFNGLYPAIVKADPSRKSVAASRPAQQEHKVQKGGRKPNTHLAEPSRARSHQMRKIGACWRCAMQRDPCDHGDPCSRCAMRSQKGQMYYFGCDRSKLPDFVGDFLPQYFLYDLQKKTLENLVNREVVLWHLDNCIDVDLSSGYGPPLRWKVYEFSPKSKELLFQLQYFQDSQSGKSYTKRKYSPPYGLLRIDSDDDARLEQYVDDLLLPHHLQGLGDCCYAAENLVDEGMFQCRVLDLLCHLYTNTPDTGLRALLRDILRMIVITYIMGHTLTLTEATLTPAIQNLRRSNKPPASQDYTSPRLANKQLKYFLQVMRSSIYEKILKWQQQTLHTGGKREQTWLHTFCAMLGFAMVLEEIQRTIICMADAKIWRKEATREDAIQEASNSCERIDERFKLLIGLFQCKYRDRKWSDKGSFGPATPELKDAVANNFLKTLRGMVEQRADHLRRRESVVFSVENQCLYTTRLTAKFLLPFLNLANVV